LSPAITLRPNWSEGRTGMARNGYLVMDSDLHMMEPGDLWERY
jgi:hypothetical protein